jgi:type II secretion system protein C
MDRQFAKYLPNVAAVILGAANLVQLVALERDLTAALEPVQTILAHRGPRGAGAADVRLLMASHLFGEAPVGTGPQTDQPPARPMILQGTIATNNPLVGFGLLGVAGHPTRVYRVGSLVGADTRLYAVYSDQVTLDHGGRLESLRFTGARQTLSAAVRYSVSETATSRPAEELQIANASEQPVPGRAQKVLAKLNAYPTWDGSGQFVGYAMNPSPKARRQYGLRPGDQLIAVNGTEASSQAGVEEALERAAGDYTLTVRRDGQSVALSLHDDGT